MVNEPLVRCVTYKVVLCFFVLFMMNQLIKLVDLPLNIITFTKLYK